jgi:hypothetical protein
MGSKLAEGVEVIRRPSSSSWKQNAKIVGLLVCWFVGLFVHACVRLRALEAQQQHQAKSFVIIKLEAKVEIQAKWWSHSFLGLFMHLFGSEQGKQTGKSK